MIKKTVILLLGVFAVIGCNKKKSNPAPEVTNEVSPWQPIENAPVDQGLQTQVNRSGYTCESSTNANEARTYWIDSTMTQMEISSSAGRQSYTLTKGGINWMFLGFDRFNVKTPGIDIEGQIYVDKNTKSIIQSDRGYYKIVFDKVPFKSSTLIDPSTSNGGSVLISGTLRCSKI